jgi:hypothetical protein
MKKAILRDMTRDIPSVIQKVKLMVEYQHLRLPLMAPSSAISIVTLVVREIFMETISIHPQVNNQELQAIGFSLIRTH